MTYRNAATGGPSHGHRESAQQILWTSVQRFHRSALGQTDTQTDHNTTLPYRGGAISMQLQLMQYFTILNKVTQVSGCESLQNLTDYFFFQGLACSLQKICENMHTNVFSNPDDRQTNQQQTDRCNNATFSADVKTWALWHTVSYKIFLYTHMQKNYDTRCWPRYWHINAIDRCN